MIPLKIEYLGEIGRSNWVKVALSSKSGRSKISKNKIDRFNYDILSQFIEIFIMKKLREVIYFHIVKKGHSEYSRYRVQPMYDGRAIIFEDEAPAE